MRSQSFTDFDNFAESISGVVSKMMLQNPKRRNWKIDAVDLGGIDVQLAQLGSGNIAQGELRAGGKLLYLPLTPEVELFANGNLLKKGSLAVLDSGCEFCITSKAEHDWATATIPDPPTCEERHLEPETSQRPTVRTTPANMQASRRFRDIVTQVIFAASQSDSFETGPAARGAAAELRKVAAHLLVQPNGSKLGMGRPKVSRKQIIARSRRHFEQHDGSAVLVGELAEAADVSERTLRNAFNEFFGVSPVRYLQLRQLHQVHRVLRTADPDETRVTNIFTQFGIWEFSRFAARYRRHFGELPSETLRNN